MVLGRERGRLIVLKSGKAGALKAESSRSKAATNKKLQAAQNSGPDREAMQAGRQAVGPRRLRTVTTAESPWPEVRRSVRDRRRSTAKGWTQLDLRRRAKEGRKPEQGTPPCGRRCGFCILRSWRTEAGSLMRRESSGPSLRQEDQSEST